MPYTHPIDFILVYSAWGLVLLTVLFAMIYTWLRKSTGELWAAALDEDQLRTTKDMTPQEFAAWIGDENLGRSAKEIDAMVDKVITHFGAESLPLYQYQSEPASENAPAVPPLGKSAREKQFWDYYHGQLPNSSEPAPQAPPSTPLSEAHAILDAPEESALKPVKRSRAKRKPRAKQVSKATQ